MLKLEAIESLIGLLELKRSFFEPNPIESMSSVWIPSHTRKLCLSKGLSPNPLACALPEVNNYWSNFDQHYR